MTVPHGICCYNLPGAMSLGGVHEGTALQRGRHLTAGHAHQEVEESSHGDLCAEGYKDT